MVTRRSTWAILSVVLVGCATMTVLRYPIVGRFDDFNEALVGEVVSDLSTGQSTVSMAAVNGGFSCSGLASVTDVPNVFVCAGQSGIADLSCSDGRRIKARYITSACNAGTGHGVDQQGRSLTFAYGPSVNASVVSGVVAAQSAKETLPVYRPQEVRKEKGFATGTAFAVAKGRLVTNYHVIDGAQDVALMRDGVAIPARVVARDPANDIAILEADVDVPPLPVRGAANAERGEDVMTLGYPLVTLQGQAQKASFGRINALSGLQDDACYLQIDVPIQPGNSGGPLISRTGEVIGIVSATINQVGVLRSSGAIAQNVNYAVKADYILPLIGSPTVPAKISSMEFPEVVRRAEKSVFLVVAK
jgi:S1-C subfamily serine protease